MRWNQNEKYTSLSAKWTHSKDYNQDKFHSTQKTYKMYVFKEFFLELSYRNRIVKFPWKIMLLQTNSLLGNYALTNSPEDDKYTQVSRRKTRLGYILIQNVKSIVNKCISTLSLEKYCHWENKYFSEFSYMLFLAASSYFYKHSSSTCLPVSHVTLQDWMNSSVATYKQAFTSKFLS